MAGRETRSGTTFSPYLSFDEPLFAPFSAAKALQLMVDDDCQDEIVAKYDPSHYTEQLLEPNSDAISFRAPSLIRGTANDSDKFEDEVATIYQADCNSNPAEDSLADSYASPLPPAINGLTEPTLRLTKSQRNNAKNRIKRSTDREARQSSTGTSLKACTLRHRKRSSPYNLPEASIVDDFQPTKPGWTNNRDKDQSWREYGLQELKEEYGMEYVDWRGNPRPLVDCDRRCVGILAGMPNDPKWDELQLDGARHIEQARQHLSVPPTSIPHRRGAFPAFQRGLSHGGGQTAPCMLTNSDYNTPILEKLMQRDVFVRIAGFTNNAFEAYAPRLFKYYSDTLDTHIAQNSKVHRIYEKSAFASATVNFGPRTISYPHIDFANLSWGLCAVTALGTFNPDLGGHLVLWDLGLIIRFPPGSTILIPSAMVRHSNTAIAKHETRYSFAQYSAGGLFRWLDNGSMTEEEYLKKASKEDLARREAEKKVRWAKGLSMLSTLSEFTL